MKRMSRNLLALFLLFFGCSGGLTADPASSASLLPKEWQGAWKQDQGPVFLNVESDRIVESDGESLIVRGLIRRDGNWLSLRRGGLTEKWKLSRDGSVLHLANERGEATRYLRLNDIPPQVQLKPLALPPSLPLPPERIQEIQAEIDRRFLEEQRILQDPARQGTFGPIRQANREFLLQLLTEVGWVDRKRFGARTPVQTALIAKHTEDLRLVMTVLSHAEEDFQRAGEGYAYAILYDAVQLDLGKKQRYGTQIYEDNAGPYVLPLEDPERVDFYRQKLGLPSLADYREKVGSAAFAKQAVRVRRDDS